MINKIKRKKVFKFFFLNEKEKTNSEKKMSSKRLQVEYNEIQKNRGNKEMGLTFSIPEDDISKARCLIIPSRDSPYRGTFLDFSIDCSGKNTNGPYPTNPPVVKFLTPQGRSNVRLHPNLYGCGKVCLSIINTWGEKGWSPIYKKHKLMTQVRALCDDNPITYEPGHEKDDPNGDNAKNYSLVIAYRCIAYAVIEMMERIHDLPEEYRNDMIYEFNDNIDYYRELLNRFCDMDGKRISCFHFGETVGYSRLKSRLESLIETYENKDEPPRKKRKQ